MKLEITLEKNYLMNQQAVVVAKDAPFSDCFPFDIER